MNKVKKIIGTVQELRSIHKMACTDKMISLYYCWINYAV